MSRDKAEVSPNNGEVAPAPGNSNAGALSLVRKEDQETVGMKHLKSTKEIEETDLHGDKVSDGVSFLLEEPPSYLKKGSNIEVGWICERRMIIKSSHSF